RGKGTNKEQRDASPKEHGSHVFKGVQFRKHISYWQLDAPSRIADFSSIKIQLTSHSCALQNDFRRRCRSATAKFIFAGRITRLNSSEHSADVAKWQTQRT